MTNQNEKKQAVAERERIELIKTIEENRKYEYEQMEKMWHKNRNYQSDLAGQIDYNQRLRQQAYERLFSLDEVDQFQGYLDRT
jgi:hypothetical protein